MIHTFDSIKVKARKFHRCDWCGEDIKPQETYLRTEHVSGDGFSRTKLHLECADPVDSYFKNRFDDTFPPHIWVRGKFEER